MNQKVVTTILIVAAVAFSIGRFSSPSKVEIKQVDRIVYQERETKEKDQNVTRTERETKLPDGTIIKEKTEVKETQTHSEKKTQGENLKISSQKVETRPSWNVGLGYEIPIEDVHRVHYSITVQRRLFSEVYLGGMVATDKTIGIVISLGF